MARFSKALLVAATCTVLAGCSQPITAGTIQLGRSLNTDNSVANLTSTFKPSETVYVAVLNPDRGDGTIGVKWYFGTQMLSEREKKVSFQGAGATSFNLQSAAGFPVGDYSVEIFVDGASVGKRNFNVAKE
ncbi:MAG: hypothetical protein ABI880_03580 [Acidobacteriota bacterium]